MRTNEKEIVSVKEAAEILGISEATLRNWIKLKHIGIADSLSGYLSLESVLNLKQSISNNENGKLKGRANKKSSNNSFIPTEYLGNNGSVRQIEELLNFFSQNKIKMQEAMFLSTIIFLVDEGMVAKKIQNLGLNDLIEAIPNKQVKNELIDWVELLDNDSLTVNFNKAKELKLTDGDDILGIIYQSLQSEGNKSAKGSYYTPTEIIKSIAESNIYNLKNPKILDPCCGTGQFLLAIAQYAKANAIEIKPDNLWGADIDDIAIRLARINLLVKFRDVDFKPNIFCIDTLLDKESQDLFSTNSETLKNGSFDLVVTNPPWGADLTKEQLNKLKKEFGEISSGESFSYFLVKAIRLLRDKGILSFILPESILNVKTHSDIRNYILSHSKILKIVYLDRVFKNVFTPVIRIDLQKEKEHSEHMVEIIKNNKSHFLPQSRFEKNQNSTFDIHTKNEDIEILDKVFQTEHITLLNNAEWALGIVTGDNKKYLINTKENGQEEIIRGKDINKYSICRNQCFIVYKPERFQQVAPEHKYRAKEKLIYKFISKNLVFAYDKDKLLTLNSANILIPTIADYPIKVILALFNSSLYQFIFSKLSNGSIKILRSHIEQLPLPLWSKSDFNKIEKIVDKILTNGEKNNKQNIAEELDDLIMDNFSLSDNQKNHIKISI